MNAATHVVQYQLTSESACLFKGKLSIGNAMYVVAHYIVSHTYKHLPLLLTQSVWTSMVVTVSIFINIDVDEWEESKSNVDYLTYWGRDNVSAIA